MFPVMRDASYETTSEAKMAAELKTSGDGDGLSRGLDPRGRDAGTVAQKNTELDIQDA